MSMKKKYIAKTQKTLATFIFSYPFILFLKSEESASSQHQECSGNDVVFLREPETNRIFKRFGG